MKSSAKKILFRKRIKQSLITKIGFIYFYEKIIFKTILNGYKKCYKKKKPWQSVDYQGFRVPQAGLEPARQKRHRILSPACLPVPPPGHGMERKTGFEPATPTLARLCSTN